MYFPSTDPHLQTQEVTVAQHVHLNGGPLHDRHVMVETGARVIVIQEPLRMPQNLTEVIDPIGNIETRKGHYSAVQHYPGEFEWDGWEATPTP